MQHINFIYCVHVWVSVHQNLSLFSDVFLLLYIFLSFLFNQVQAEDYFVLAQQQSTIHVEVLDMYLTRCYSTPTYTCTFAHACTHTLSKYNNLRLKKWKNTTIHLSLSRSRNSSCGVLRSRDHAVTCNLCGWLYPDDFTAFCQRP